MVSKEEFETMKEHTLIDASMLDKLEHYKDEKMIKIAYQICRWHHERWDGKGYPDGLKETEIPLCARIMAVADVFDAVSAKRCYRDAMPLDQCFHIIEEGRGRDYDPVLVDVFIEIEDKIRKVYEESKAE